MGKGKIVIYCDGACSNNGKPGAMGGLGLHFPNEELNDISQKLFGRITNQRAEIIAVLKAVAQAKHFRFDEVVVFTDSEYVVKGINKWIYSWQQNGWKNAKGLTVANQGEFERLYRATQKIPSKIVWTRRDNNTEADSLAKRAIARQKRRASD